MYKSIEATFIAPRWESAPWYIDAKAACASHDVLPYASKDHNDTTTTAWALVDFHFNRKKKQCYTSQTLYVQNDSNP